MILPDNQDFLSLIQISTLTNFFMYSQAINESINTSKAPGLSNISLFYFFNLPILIIVQK